MNPSTPAAKNAPNATVPLSGRLSPKTKRMLHSYFRIAFRYLTRNKAATLINVSGLAIGMATALLIGLWIADEASFDHYSPNHRRIAEIMLLQRLTSSGLGHHATPQHPETFIGPTIAPVTGTSLAQKRFSNTFGTTALVTWPGDHVVGTGDKKLARKGVWAESTLPRIFGFHMLEGSSDALKDPSTILLAQSTAKPQPGSKTCLRLSSRSGTKRSSPIRWTACISMIRPKPTAVSTTSGSSGSSAASSCSWPVSIS
jgi:hypothetical protein